MYIIEKEYKWLVDENKYNKIIRYVKDEKLKCVNITQKNYYFAFKSSDIFKSIKIREIKNKYQLIIKCSNLVNDVNNYVEKREYLKEINISIAKKMLEEGIDGRILKKYFDIHIPDYYIFKYIGRTITRRKKFFYNTNYYVCFEVCFDKTYYMDRTVDLEIEIEILSDKEEQQLNKLVNQIKKICTIENKCISKYERFKSKENL